MGSEQVYRLTAVECIPAFSLAKILGQNKPTGVSGDLTFAGIAQAYSGLHGCSPDRPIAIVQQGTTRHQRVITGTLAEMPSKMENAEIKPPTLIIVGTVVTMHKQLDWFQHH